MTKFVPMIGLNVTYRVGLAGSDPRIKVLASAETHTTRL